MNQHHDTEGIILIESTALAWHLLWPNVNDGWEGLDTKFAKSVAEPVIRKDQQGKQLQGCWLKLTCMQKTFLIILLCLLYEFSLLQFWTWPWWISQAWQRFLLEINPLTLRCKSEVCCFSLSPNQIAWSWQCRLQTLILPTQMLWKLQRKWILKVRSSIMWNLHAAKSNGLVTHDCFSLYLGP